MTLTERQLHGLANAADLAIALPAISEAWGAEACQKTRDAAESMREQWFVQVTAPARGFAAQRAPERTAPDAGPARSNPEDKGVS